MQTKQGYVGVGILTAIIFGFAVLAVSPAFAQTDDYGTTAGTYCPQLFQTVVRGSSGNQVLELQKFLSDYYDISPATIQTGYFGRITQGYVIQFQKEQGLPAYGIAGSMTRTAIAKVCSKVTISDPVVPQTESKNVQLDYPRNGDSYMIGSKMHISSWPKSGMEGGVALSLVDLQGNEKQLVNLGGETTSYDWVVGKLSWGDQVVQGTYKVRLRFACNCTTSDGKFYDSNGWFTITPSLTQTTGTLSGHLTIGPMCTSNVGDQSKCATAADLSLQSYKGQTMAFYKPDKTTNLGIFTPGSDGAISLNLEAGDYWITAINSFKISGTKYVNERNMKGLPVMVTIRAGEVTPLNVNLDLSAQ